jgi:hypothetical protein
MVQFFPILHLTKFCKLHFPVLFPCNSHAYLCPHLLCIGTIIISFHSSCILSSSQICLNSSYFLFSSLFPPNFINSRCIPSVPAALLYFKFLIAFFYIFYSEFYFNVTNFFISFFNLFPWFFCVQKFVKILFPYFCSLLCMLIEKQ